MSDKPTTLLRIDNLVIEARQGECWARIVDGVSLSLNRGEVLGLIGESGAGKSTLGITAMGYAKPGCRIASGSILFDGQELVGAPDEELRALRGVRVAYVAQSAAAAFNPAHRLGQQFAETAVQEGRMSRAEAEQRAVELFRRLGLPDPERLGGRYPHQVSGGQLQRCMVAMAMACNPDLIVFDEPTTALDVTTQIEVLEAIKEAIAAYGTSAIYITHDLAVVAQIADRIMVLRHGREVETGETRTLLANPTKSYTRALLTARRARSEEEPRAPTDPVVEVRCVSAEYRSGPKVLDNVSLQVMRGQTIAVVGESGSGKSTLARVICGLLPQSAGAMLFEGTPLAPALRSRTRDQLRRIQMIHQMPDMSLNPRHRVRKILSRPLELYFGLRETAAEERIRDLLDRIELGERYLDRFPAELSGGEKQRLCIARALAAEPDVIVCDEVTSALDQLVGEEILRLLQRLQETLGISYLFITHDLNTVRAIADEILVMHKGSVVEQGPKADILAPPFALYTELLLSSVPHLDPDWLKRVEPHRVELLARWQAAQGELKVVGK
jgi:peptide/nickel transport system ATP-binding protein